VTDVRAAPPFALPATTIKNRLLDPHRYGHDNRSPFLPRATLTAIEERLVVTKKATVTWLRDLTFDANMDGKHLTIDASPGFGHDRGPTPMNLFLSALAGCTAMDVISILRKSRQPVTDFLVYVEGQQAEDHPRRLESIELVYEVHGEGVDRKAVERAVNLSTERYCTVQATIVGSPPISQRIEIVGGDEDDGDGQK
jgi:putative redox protein